MARPKHSSNKPNAKGRNKNPTGRFARIDHQLLYSAAYRSLSPNARSLLIELISLSNGSNNGSIWLSIRDAAARMGVSDPKAASAAFEELISTGLIAMTKEAFFSIKSADTSKARCWRLTWIYDNANKKPASNEWSNFEPEPGSKSAKRMERGLAVQKKYKKGLSHGKFPVVDFTSMDDDFTLLAQKAVVDSTTDNYKNDVKPSLHIGGKTTTHIAMTMRDRVGDQCESYWWGCGTVKSAARARLSAACLHAHLIYLSTAFVECAA